MSTTTRALNSSHGRRTDGRGERAYDIYSRLLKERVIFIVARSRTTWPT